ncbi:MAG: radical SAM protein [Selenomonadaceae bacterium]|nr:radical SAM protein [Selenomonadaceae bacterium]
MEELDIVFLNLHRRYINYRASYGGFRGIYLLSAFVRNEGYSAKSFAGSLKNGKEILDELCQTKSVAMVGLYCDFENITENIFLSRYIKETYNLPVIVGGPQATALGKDFFTESKCDAVVRYEGELTVLELMNFFLEDCGELSEILGISYLDGDKIHVNAERPLIKNLDALPFVDEDCYIMPDDFYYDLSLMTGRGCPFSCAFCHEGTHTKKVRFRSAENVLAEIEAYLKKWRDGELYILFTDDTFTLNVDRVKKICEGLAELRKEYDFNFFCEGHVHTLYQNPQMIDYLVKGGCVRIQLGIESGNDFVLKAYGKHSTTQEILEVVKLCRDKGIQQIFGNIILGGAHFSRETFAADKKFARQILEEGRGTLELGVVTFWPLAETKMTNCPKLFGLEICDKEFVTSVGDFPQTRTEDINRLEICQMKTELQKEINAQMISMLENWEVPTDLVMKWFNTTNRNAHGLWFIELTKQEILYSYFEMLHLGEGFHSSDIENISTAHPMRVVQLSKYLKRIDDDTAEICGEIFSGKELEVVLLTAGKLSVAEIANRIGITIDEVTKILGRLEPKHFIVYAPN